MMEREESNSLTDLTSNFRHEQFEGEMKLRLAVPFDAWGPIGREGLLRPKRALICPALPKPATETWLDTLGSGV